MNTPMNASPPAISPVDENVQPGYANTFIKRAILFIGVGILGIVFLLGGEGNVSILDTIFIMAIATLALNVISGYGGQLSFGITFFMSIGAYTAALLGGDRPTFPGDPAGLGFSFIIWLPLAGVIAGLAGLLVGPIALRLKGFYLAIVTLALVFIGQYIFKNLPFITGGSQGRIFPSPAIGDFIFASPSSILGITPTANQCFFLLSLALLALSSVFVWNVMRTRAGRALHAIRRNETSAALMGVNVFHAKMGAFILSSFLAGIAGALWASSIGFAEPGTWSLLFSFQVVAAMLVGGIGSVWGSILGAAFIFGMPQLLQQLPLFSQSANAGKFSAGDVSTLLYGLLIIVFMLFEPEGIVGLIRRFPGLFNSIVSYSKMRRKGGMSVITSMRNHIFSQ
jgi:branched-chain amino acid transport system permease protein